MDWKFPWTLFFLFHKNYIQLNLCHLYGLFLNNASRDNKNLRVIAFYTLLIYQSIFCEIYNNFFIIGHIRKDIDALFGQWRTMLKTNNYPTLLRLMKSFMDCETHLGVFHFIEEFLDFKRFVDVYLGTCKDFLEDHSRSQ